MEKSLQDKNIIVTGVNYGIGFEACLEFAKRGANVIMTCRDPNKCTDVLNQMKRESLNDNIELESLDLSSLRSIEDFSTRMESRLNKLDILVNNAGLNVIRPYTQTEDGIELHFMVNYLGHYYLTRLLLDLLKKSNSSRILNVSSEAHRNAKMNWDDLQYEENYSNFECYRQSKLAQILFTQELARRLEGTNVSVVALDPGVFMIDVCGTKGGQSKTLRCIYRLMWPFFCLFGEIPSSETETIVFCATSELIPWESGSYYKNCFATDPSTNGSDRESALKLWIISAQLVGLKNEKKIQ